MTSERLDVTQEPPLEGGIEDLPSSQVFLLPLPISSTSDILPPSSFAALSPHPESTESETEKTVRRSRKEKRSRSDDEGDMSGDHQEEEEMGSAHKKYKI